MNVEACLDIALPTGLVFFLIGFAVSYNVSLRDWHDCLVKQGHAEYYLDENNQRQWRLKEK